MAVETDINFQPRGAYTRNGAIRFAHPLTYTKTANGLYMKYRKRIAGFMYFDGEAFVPTGASYTQVNVNAGPDLSTFNCVAALGDIGEGRFDSTDAQYRLILHTFGRDIMFRTTFTDNAFALITTCAGTRNWYNAQVADPFNGNVPHIDSLYFECIDDGASPELRGWLLEEAIMEVADAP